MKQIFLLVFFIFLYVSLPAQNYDLKLFTQEGCDRCNSVLEILDEYKINYQNCDISNDECQTEMWVELSKVGEYKLAMVPVLILNSELIFPVYKNGIMQKTDRVEFTQNLARELSNQLSSSEIKTTIVKKTNKSTFNTNHAKYYVICGSFSKLENAEIFHKKLIDQGYLNSKIINNGGLIKVSISNFTYYQDAKRVQSAMEKTYKNPWIYTQN